MLHPTIASSPVSKHSILDDFFGSCTPISGFATPTELEKVFTFEQPKFQPQSLSKLEVPSFQFGPKAQRIYSDEQTQPSMDFQELITPTLPTSFELQELLSSTTFKLGSVPATKKQKKKKPEPKEEVQDEESDSSRHFKKVTDSQADIKIKMKTRNEQYKSSIDEKLYSSMKYEIKIQMDVGDTKFPCLLARAQLVDAINYQVIPNSLDGVTECAMSEVNDAYEGSLRIQISNTLSFHHTKTEYAIQIKFFNPKEVSDAISFASSVSPSFKIYARKPNMKMEEKEKKVQKRKIKEDSQPQKKRKEFSAEEKKFDQVSSEFFEFASCLEKLLEVKNKLNSNDQLVAMNLVKLKLEELAASEDFQF